MKTIAGYVVLTCKFYKEGTRWVGVCDELGTSAFGLTIEDAKIKLSDLVILNLNTLDEVGERDRFFAENGIKLHTVKPRSLVDMKVSTKKDQYVAPCIYPVREMVLA